MSIVSGLPRVERVLVMELAGLGDIVHLLPALWLARRQWPDAKLHVMVNAHVAGLFELTPWVDRVWAYPIAPRPGLRDNALWVRDLRRERFDLLLNTSGSDRSSLLSFAAGARMSIGRRPADGGPPGWALLFDRVIEIPHYAEPMMWQKWHFMRRAGVEGKAIDGDAPQFHVKIDPQLRRAAGIGPGDEGRYIHLSPFTTADARELPGAQVADLVAGLRAAHPGLQVVISCAATERERAKLAALLPLLREAPWKIFAGTLTVASLAAVIEKCALNLSGDTGSLHLAAMCGTPAVAWFRAHKGEKEWIPLENPYRVLVAEGGAPDALHGIETRSLLAAAAELLA
jgi:heptosyltransferase-1/heptosyltransferase-2